MAALSRSSYPGLSQRRLFAISRARNRTMTQKQEAEAEVFDKSELAMMDCRSGQLLKSSIQSTLVLVGMTSSGKILDSCATWPFHR